MRRPEQYQAVRAWEEMLGSPMYLIIALQKMASRENAPIDACFKIGLGEWHRLTEVHNPETKRYLQEHHPELFK